MKRLMAAVATAAAAVLVAASPASATIEVRDHWTDAWDNTFSDCGLEDIHEVGSAHGTFTARTLRSSDGEAWLGHNNYYLSTHFENPANGRSLSLELNGNWREIAGTHVSGTIWQFAWKDSGATWTVRDADGDVVYRDRGTISGVDVYDTLGDDQIGGELISTDIVSLKGKFNDVDFCTDVLVRLLG